MKTLVRPLLRLASVLFVGAILGQLLVLWDATGRRVFTFYPSEAFAELQQNEGKLTGLFDQAQENPSLPPINNKFGLGLLPSGGGQDAVSVMTLGLPAIGLGFLAFFRGCRKPIP